jgi:hypothetical protein
MSVNRIVSRTLVLYKQVKTKEQPRLALGVDQKKEWIFMDVEQRFSGLRGCGLSLIAMALVSALSAAQVNAAGKGAKDEPDDFFSQVEQAANPSDFEKLKESHMSDLTQWQGVQPARIDPKAPAATYTWKTAEAGNVAPLGPEPATTMIAVPEDGEYRIWLRYVARPDVPQPVTLALTGANQVSHVFGSKGLLRQDGKTQEKTLSIRFEAEYQRMSTPSKPTPVWEYWDVPLKAGATKFAITSKNKELRTDRLLITRSKSFTPSLSTDANSATLSRTYYRFKVVGENADGGKPGEPALTMAGGLTYHWGRPPKPNSGSTQPIWYYPFFGGPELAAATPKGLKLNEWSGFVDVTDPISSPGPWATAALSIGGLPKENGKYRLQAQVAWYPHEGAVMKQVETAVGQNTALVLIPIDSRGYTCTVSKPDDKAGVWGMRSQAYLKLMETTEDVNQRHMGYAKDALANLPRQGNPAPKLIKLSTGNGAAPAVRDSVTRMLASIGINSIGGASPELRKELGLRDESSIYNNDALLNANTHDAADPLIEKTLDKYFESLAKGMDAKAPGASAKVTTLKMGDEIGAIVGPVRINELPDARKQFHDYLREQLRLMGKDASFFGAKDVEDLEFSLRLAPDAGRFERRLYYHASRFNFVFTARFYRRYTDAARKHFPNIRSYCNFSPHPPMFGQHMNGSDWFALTREGGATMAWAEDWAGLFGGWGFAGIQTVSYYGALVECAARKGELPSGFYVVTTMGGADRKMFCVLAHGVMDLELYSFGPRYAGAEFSNFWDDRSAAYAEIARGAFALGPADEIIARGKRQERKTALLYNRSHEIWNNGTGGFQSDRLLTFIALQQAHLPVDIILEEDLTPENLKQYSVVYVQGYNLSDRNVQALDTWVKAGGTLVGIAGTAMRDEYNDQSDAGAKLFGATQRYVGASVGAYHPQSIPGHKPIDKITIQEGPLTPAMQADVVGTKMQLAPTTGKPVATFSDGSAAAVYQEVGKGKTLLWAVMPGLMFKGDVPGGNHFRLDRAVMITKAATATLGRSRLQVSDPLVEACLFEHSSGIAVTLNEVGLLRVSPKETAQDADAAVIEPAPAAQAPAAQAPAPGQAANPDAGATLQTLVVPAAAVPAPAPAPAQAAGPLEVMVDGNSPKTITIWVQTDRPIKEVMTSYAGPVPFKREGDRIVVEVPLPKPVDVLILR